MMSMFFLRYINFTIVIFLFFGVGLFASPLVQDAYNPGDEPAVRAVTRALPSVVSLTTESTVTVMRDPFADMLKDFQGLYRPSPLFQQRQTQKVGGFGSGVIIDSSGYIVSNFHTIKEKKDLKIVATLSNGQAYPAQVVAVDQKNDLALLKIESKMPLPSARLANSDEIMLGQTVLALGNPFGLDNTVTRGIVSAKSRNVKSGTMQYDELIQTDAAINPGNSGGALIDLGGRLVGVNVLVLAKSQGISFAIPTNKVIDVLMEIFSLEKVKNVNLGLLYSIRNDLIEIRQIRPGSSASGQLYPGDKIVSLDGRSFLSFFALQQYLVEKKNAGDTVRFVVERAGKIVEVDIRLKEFDRSNVNRRLGLDVQALTGQIAALPGVDLKGLLISKVDEKSPAYQAGVRQGMILTSIDEKALESPRDLEQFIQSAPPHKACRLGLVLFRQIQGGGIFRQNAVVEVPLMSEKLK